MDKVIEARREKFEVYAVTSAWLAVSEEDMERDGDGYFGMEVHSSWLAYNAALDSLCVELPSKFDTFTNYEDGWDDAVEAIREAIHAAGVKTK